MKTEPGRSLSAPLVLISMTLRMFMGMIFSPTKASNAVWMCPLIGWLICLPFLWCLNRSAALGPMSAWKNLDSRGFRPLTLAAGLVFGLALAYDAAIVMRLLANTAGVVALSSVPGIYLMVPLVLLVFAVLMLDSDAIGSSARIWLHVLPLLLVIMLVGQLRSFEPGWVLPVLGGGVRTILQGSVDCAGWIAMTSLLWLVSVPDRGKGRLMPTSLLAAVAAAALLVLLVMLCPTLVDTQFTRAERLQLLLSNGRVELSLQLVLILLWYTDLLYLLCAQTGAAMCFLRGVFCKVPKWLSALVCAVGVGLLALLGVSGDKIASQTSRFLYIGAAAVLFAMMLAAFFKKGGSKACASES